MLASSHGKIGNAADIFVKNYLHTCGIISREAQARLFELIYPTYVARAKSIYNGYAAVVNNAVRGEHLHTPIREMVVDFVYQGLGFRSIIEPYMSNDFDSIIYFIETDRRTPRYEHGRQRANYLRRHRV